MDCEGAEKDLVSQTTASSLAETDLLIECHDFADRSITPTLTALLGKTHQVGSIEEGGRDPNRYGPLRQWASVDRWLAVEEGRPETMTWLVCHTRRDKHSRR
jgi:hypothetical protein